MLISIFHRQSGCHHVRISDCFHFVYIVAFDAFIKHFVNWIQKVYHLKIQIRTNTTPTHNHEISFPEMVRLRLKIIIRISHLKWCTFGGNFRKSDDITKINRYTIIILSRYALGLLELRCHTWRQHLKEQHITFTFLTFQFFGFFR